MNWLSQNWLYLLTFVIAVVFVGWRTRRAAPGGHAGHHGSFAEAPAVDPVSGEAVDPTHGFAGAYQGRVYYFASRENRERFEASPERFVAPQAELAADGRRQHRGHGCC